VSVDHPRDQPVPLATTADMDRSTLRSLIGGLDETELAEVMMRATRECEAFTGRRLAPFTAVTETQQAHGADASDLGDVTGDPLVALGMSYSRALAGTAGQVRRVWVDQYAPLFPEMWSYSDVTVRILRSGGTGQVVPAHDLLGGGIAPDTGELWFRIGTWLPVGSRVSVTYSGGYSPVPLALVNACRWMAAAELVEEDDYPGDAPGLSARRRGDSGKARTPGFRGRAEAALAPFMSRR